MCSGVLDQPSSRDAIDAAARASDPAHATRRWRGVEDVRATPATLLRHLHAVAARREREDAIAAPTQHQSRATNNAGDKIWKEAARFFAEVSQLFDELVTYEVRDDQEIEHCTSVLSASGLKVREKKAHYDKVQATIKKHKANTVLKDRIAG